MAVNDALLLVGHGSVRYPDAGNALHRHAVSLRAQQHFAQVEVALLNGTPTVDEALARIEAPVIRIVPFFMEHGFFSRVAVPRSVTAAMKGDPRQTFLCPPIGVHDAMAGIIEHLAQAACSDLAVQPADAAVLVVGHGSATAPGRALALHHHAATVAAAGRFAQVEAACLEEAPFVADTLALLRAHPVVVIGFFANRGGHVRDDVPALIAAEQARRAKDGPVVHFYGSVTDDPTMLRIILDQAEARTLEPQ